MLEVRDLDIYYGASQAVYGVGLSAQAGEVMSVMGRNGVGKTTLLRSIAGQQAIKRGQILWQGKDITHLPSHKRAKLGVAIVPQGREIFSQLTVLENLKIGFSCLPRPKRKIHDEIFELFPVLKEMLRRRGGDLSGGQQQQLAIARALVTQPKLLILDEPTEGIQPSIIKDIQGVIGLLRDRGTMAILLVEQYFDFAKALSDRYAVMDRGQIILSGAGAEMDEKLVRSHLTV